MARKPHYKLDNVFQYALPLVIEKGFNGCNMDSLIRKTGFNRRAFYQHFANKQAFFEALLDHYIKQDLFPLFDILKVKEGGTQLISTFFQAYENLLRDKGCLLVKMLMELGKQSEEVQRLARAYYDELTQQFIALLERAKANSEVAQGTDIEKEALLLTFLTQSFAVSDNLIQGKQDIHAFLDLKFSHR